MSTNLLLVNEATTTMNGWIQECQTAVGRRKDFYDGIRLRFSTDGVTMVSPEEAYDHIMSNSRLNLSKCRVKQIFDDITPLSVFHHITGLVLSNHQITNLGAFPNLTVLELDENRIQDVSFLSNLRGLSVLALNDNNISDLNPLSNLKALTCLRLENNQIINIKPIAGLVDLKELCINGNCISDIRPLRKLKNLTTLNVTDNQINDLKPLKKLENLTKLLLSGNQINNLKPISGHVGLTGLWIRDNFISDITPLSNLIYLTTLGMGENKINALQPIASLAELRNLDIGQNCIWDISPLSNLTHLTVIRFAQNFIQDFRPLDHVERRNGIVEGKEDQYVAPRIVFLSHTGQDKRALDFVVFLNETLKDRYRIPTFFDVDSIEYGTNWMTTIKWNVEHCNLFVCNFSTQYPTRYWPMKELDLAFITERKILPVFHSTDSLKVTPALRNQMKATLESKQDLLEEEGTDVETVLNRWCDNLRKLHQIQGIRNDSTSKKGQIQLRDRVSAVVKELLGK